MVLDVGCRKLGGLVFDQSQGENLLGWCALEFEKEGKELKTPDDLEIKF